MNKPVIRKGVVDDVNELGNLYNELNDYLSETVNYPGWIKGIILNHEPEKAYHKVKWDIETDYNKIIVIRTLVVHPKFMQQVNLIYIKRVTS